MLFQSMYSWPRPHVQVDLHAIVQLWQAMHLFVSMIMQNCFSGPGASYGYSRSRPSCQLETWAMSLCLLHVGAGEVGGERRRGPLRAEAERERAPEPLASETAVLGLHDLGEGLLRRRTRPCGLSLDCPRRGRVHVEPGADHARRRARVDADAHHHARHVVVGVVLLPAAIRQ